MNLISRKSAKQRGFSLYFTGKLCKNGHISQRRVSNSACCQCESEYNSQYSQQHKEKRREHNRKYWKRKFHTDNDYRKYVRQNRQHWRKTNPNKVKQIAQQQYKKHAAKYHAAGAKYRASKKEAVVKWCEVEQIKELYKIALLLKSQTGIPHHVDHIVPLQHNLVCGLHCLANLRIITATENCSKSNSFEI